MVLISKVPHDKLLASEVNTLDDAVDQNIADISAINTDLDTLSANIDANNEDITSLGNSVNANTQNITNLQTSQSAQAQSITNLQSLVTSHTQSLANIISINNQQAAAIQSNANNIQGNTDSIVAINQRLTTAENDIDAQLGYISTHNTAIINLQNAVATLQGNLADINNKLNAIKNKQYARIMSKYGNSTGEMTTIGTENVNGIYSGYYLVNINGMVESPNNTTSYVSLLTPSGVTDLGVFYNTSGGYLQIPINYTNILNLGMGNKSFALRIQRVNGSVPVTLWLDDMLVVEL